MRTEATLESKLYIASDHAGFGLKKFLIENLAKTEPEIAIIDLGTNDETSCDYPIFAKKLADEIEENSRGILICGTGIGMSIAANRFKHIRAALCCNQTMATYARRHNDANVLVLGARIIEPGIALDCAKFFLHTDFDGDRHAHRLEIIRGF